MGNHRRQYYQNEELKDQILYAMQWSYDHFYNENLKNNERYGNWWH